MSITCEYCGQIMGEGEGCSCTYMKFKPILPESLLIQYKDKENNDLIRSRTLILPRTRVGAVNDFFTAEKYKEMERERCLDCGAKVGTCHHESCDEERCPRCGGQLLSCNCWDDYEIEFMEDYQPVEPEYVEHVRGEVIEEPQYSNPMHNATGMNAGNTMNVGVGMGGAYPPYYNPYLQGVAYYGYIPPMVYPYSYPWRRY